MSLQIMRHLLLCYTNVCFSLLPSVKHLPFVLLVIYVAIAGSFHVRYALLSVATWPRHVCFFSESIAGHVFLGEPALLLHHHRLLCSFSSRRIAVVVFFASAGWNCLSYGNHCHFQRDEHTNGQYTNAMQMHVHAR